MSIVMWLCYGEVPCCDGWRPAKVCHIPCGAISLSLPYRPAIYWVTRPLVAFVITLLFVELVVLCRPELSMQATWYVLLYWLMYLTSMSVHWSYIRHLGRSEWRICVNASWATFLNISHILGHSIRAPPRRWTAPWGTWRVSWPCPSSIWVLHWLMVSDCGLRFGRSSHPLHWL